MAGNGKTEHILWVAKHYSFFFGGAELHNVVFKLEINNFGLSKCQGIVLSLSVSTAKS